MCENLQLICAVLRIGIYSFFRRLCGYGPPAAKPNVTVLCLGLEKSGKSTLLAVLSGEKSTEIPSTVGFSIKALMFDDCIVDVKELGGGDGVRPYWDRYFLGAQGVIFVVNSSSSDEDLKQANYELHKSLADPELDNLPLMVLCNYQDKEGAKTPEQLTDILELRLEDTHRKWTVQACSMHNKESIRDAFLIYNKILLESRKGTSPENSPKQEEKPVTGQSQSFDRI